MKSLKQIKAELKNRETLWEKPLGLLEAAEGAARYLRAMAERDGNPDLSGDLMIAKELEAAIKREKAKTKN